MKKIRKLTFVIPTKNRTIFLKRQISRCTKIFNKKFYTYIIIDASNNFYHYQNKKLFKNNENIKLFRQKSKGIQKGCFESLRYVKTEYVSFLYDDDQLSKHIIKIHKSNLEDRKEFSFGYGIVKDLNYKVSFNKLNYLNFDIEDMLLAYNGLNINNFIKINKIKENIVLPLSPICTIYTVKFLNQWRKIVLKFVKKNEFRNFFLLKKEIGPDLLIYLLSIAKSDKKVKFFYPFTAKFSSHEKSISVIYGSNLLRIGYWLSRVCFFEQKIIKYKNFNEKVYTYLILTGIYLLFTNLFRPFYLKNIFLELYKIISFHPYSFSLNYCKKIIINRFKK